MRSSFSMPLLYHAYVYLEFLILACTIYILAPIVLSGDESFNPHSRKGSDNGLVLFAVLFLVSIHTPAKGVTGLSSDYFAKADVSIHTPAKGVTSSSTVRYKAAKFQYTHPQRE